MFCGPCMPKHWTDSAHRMTRIRLFNSPHARNMRKSETARDDRTNQLSTTNTKHEISWTWQWCEIPRSHRIPNCHSLSSSPAHFPNKILHSIYFDFPVFRKMWNENPIRSKVPALSFVFRFHNSRNSRLPVNVFFSHCLNMRTLSRNSLLN